MKVALSLVELAAMVGEHLQLEPKTLAGAKLNFLHVFPIAPADGGPAVNRAFSLNPQIDLIEFEILPEPDTLLDRTPCAKVA